LGNNKNDTSYRPLHFIFFKKSAIKRDGPVFFSSAPDKVAGDERTIIVIVAPAARLERKTLNREP
jgi:hypothetical protein